MSNGEVEELTKNQFDKVINEEVVVVDFYDELEMSCIMAAPVMNEVAKKFESVNFCRINVEECKDLTQKYNIFSAPSVLVFENGKEVNRITETPIWEKVEEILFRLRNY